jgi:hypothetical protein
MPCFLEAVKAILLRQPFSFSCLCLGGYLLGGDPLPRLRSSFKWAVQVVHSVRSGMLFLKILSHENVKSCMYRLGGWYC